MEAYIINSLIGVFAFDKNGKLLDKILYSKPPDKILNKITGEELTIEEKKIIEKLKKKGVTNFILSKKNKKKSKRL